jgi:hypothetical protein
MLIPTASSNFKTHVYISFNWKTWREKQLRGCRRRWKDNIKTDLAEDRGRWRSFVNTIKNFRIPWLAERLSACQKETALWLWTSGGVKCHFDPASYVAVWAGRSGRTSARDVQSVSSSSFARFTARPLWRAPTFLCTQMLKTAIFLFVLMLETELCVYSQNTTSGTFRFRELLLRLVCSDYSTH